MRLADRLLESIKDYISFPDLLFSLSSVNNEPLFDVVEYLDCRDFDRLDVFSIGPRYEPLPSTEPLDIIHYFLEGLKTALLPDNSYWVLADGDSLDALPIEAEQEITRLFDEHAGNYFKISELLSFAPLEGYLGFLEPDTAGEEAASLQGNNSLASYMTEYTLPQVVALILHIDLADITTSPNTSYVHEQSKYDEGSYHKFENLLQSYSVSALNNKIDGADVFTRKVSIYGGGDETYINLEKTTISRSNLASYLGGIGYQLDDLIAKQEPTHAQRSQYDGYQQEDSDLVSSLQQQVADLQTRLDEKEGELKAESAKLKIAQDKIKELGKLTSGDKELNDNTANDYQVTIGALLELLRTSKGIDNKGKPNEPLFRTQAAILDDVVGKLLPNHAKTKVSDRFTDSNAALAKAKKKRDSDLDYKAALAERIKEKASLSEQ